MEYSTHFLKERRGIEQKKERCKERKIERDKTEQGEERPEKHHRDRKGNLEEENANQILKGRDRLEKCTGNSRVRLRNGIAIIEQRGISWRLS